MKPFSFLPVMIVATVLAQDEPKPEEKKPDAPADRGKTIWLITKGGRESYWKAARIGAMKAGKDLGVKINWQAPLTETDLSKQIQLVEQAITQRADGILLSPITETGLTDVIGRAAGANIPVVIFDSPTKSDKPAAFLATDQVKAGELAARRIGEATGGKGRVLMIRGHPDNSATMAREEAFKKALAREYADIKLLDNYGRGDRQKSTEVSEEMLKAYSDAAAIYASNENSTFGALAAVASRGLTGKIKVIGSDASRQLAEALALGTLDALVVQAPAQMGYKGVQAVVDAMDGKSVDKRTDTAVELATKENMNDPSIKELLSPEGR